jgi:hypothetical protein
MTHVFEKTNREGRNEWLRMKGRKVGLKIKIFTWASYSGECNRP